MKWIPSLMLLPLGAYLLSQGMELLTVLLLLAVFAVFLTAVGDLIRPRTRRGES